MNDRILLLINLKFFQYHPLGCCWWKNKFSVWQISRPPCEWCKFEQIFNGRLGHPHKLGDWKTAESWPMLKFFWSESFKVLLKWWSFVLYFDQILGACSTQKLAELLFFSRFQPFLFILNLISTLGPETLGRFWQMGGCQKAKSGSIWKKNGHRVQTPKGTQYMGWWNFLCQISIISPTRSARRGKICFSKPVHV